MAFYTLQIFVCEIDKTNGTATFHGSVNDTNGDCVERGFQYGLTKTDTWEVHETGSFNDSEMFSLPVTGLALNTDFYARTYLKDSGGSYVYTDEWAKFTTKDLAAEIVVLSNGGYFPSLAEDFFRTFDKNGQEVNAWALTVGYDVSEVMVDKAGNAYYGYSYGGNYYVAKHRLSNGELLDTWSVTAYPRGLCVGPLNKYIYILEHETLYKRNKSDLVEVSHIDLISSSSYVCGITVDNDSYVYLVRTYPGSNRFEKYDFGTGTRIAYRSFSVQVSFGNLGIAGGYVYAGAWFDVMAKAPLDLSSSTTWTPTGADWDSENWFFHLAPYKGGILVEGTPNDSYQRHIALYNSDGSLVWYEGLVRGIECMAGCPFANYDYPLAPILFPAKPKHSTLKEKCVNFEESMSDMCINMNHNVNVTREYLQTVYGGEEYDESSNLRDVLSSQQLVKLSNKDLTTEDYYAIINNFITNILSMFTLLNENNSIVKQWLDDYEPTGVGHEYTDVKMLPITISKDLSKTMDELFECIEDNVITLNSNLELLKERF